MCVLLSVGVGGVLLSVGVGVCRCGACVCYVTGVVCDRDYLIRSIL